jgi:hypothetical protein
LEIDYAVARDIQTENIQEIVTILTDWLKSCESCSSCLQEQIENANAEKARRIKHKEQLQEQVRMNSSSVFLYWLFRPQLAEVKKNIKKQSSSQPSNFEDADGEFLPHEKNLNMKEKRRGPKQGTSKGGTWFKNFN